MAKKVNTTKYGEKFAVFYSDDECFGVYPTLEEATKAATEDLECGEETDYVICLLVPKRTVQALRVVVEDV